MITRRKYLEAITLVAILLNSSRCLGVMLDARLDFKHHAEKTISKVAVVSKTLSRLMIKCRWAKIRNATVTRNCHDIGTIIWHPHMGYCAKLTGSAEKRIPHLQTIRATNNI